MYGRLTTSTKEKVMLCLLCVYELEAVRLFVFGGERAAELNVSLTGKLAESKVTVICKVCLTTTKGGRKR